jgi:hypothetical protein
MRKTIISAIVLVSMLLIITGCGSSETDSVPGEDKESSDSSGDDFSDEPTKSSGASGAASELLPLCLGVQDRMYMKMCAAAMNGNANMCDDVKHEKPNDQQYFQAMCRSWVAAVNKDFAACKSINTNTGGQQLFDCESFVAEAMGDQKLCAKLSSETARNGCTYRVNSAAGQLKLSDCIEPECVFQYAMQHHDADACNKFADVTTAYVEEQKFACNAMVKGDTSKCRQAPGGMMGFELCMKKGGMGKTILGNGNFEPSACGDDKLCLRATLIAMVSYVASS